MQNTLMIHNDSFWLPLVSEKPGEEKTNPKCTMSSATLSCSPHMSRPPMHHSLCAVHFSSPSLPVVHSSGQENGQASWLRLNRHTYRRALPEHLSFSLRLKHAPCQFSGWSSLSLFPSLSVGALSATVAASMQVCKDISAYLFQSLLAIKSGDGRKGPVCSPVPQRSPDGLLYELAMSCVIPVSLSPCPLPPPIHTPFHSWKRMKRVVTCRRRFVPVCQDKWTKNKQKKEGPNFQSSETKRAFVFCDS